MKQFLIGTQGIQGYRGIYGPTLIMEKVLLDSQSYTDFAQFSYKRTIVECAVEVSPPAIFFAQVKH